MMMSNYGFPIKTEYIINETELIIPEDVHTTWVDNSKIHFLPSVVVKTEPLDPIIVKTESLDPTVVLSDEENSTDIVESQVKYKRKHLANTTDILNEDSSSEELPVLSEDADKDLASFTQVLKPNVIKYDKDRVEKSLSSSHKCEYCEYVTASRLCLRQHENNGCHPRFKPLKCSLCDYSVHGRRTMAKHIELHSSEMAISCDYCNFLTLTPFSISLHCKKMHQNQYKPPSMSQKHLEHSSTFLNHLDHSSTLFNQLEHSSSTLIKLEPRSNSGLKKLKHPSEHQNHLEHPSENQNHLEFHSWLVNQLESPSTGLNQLESLSTGLNQLVSPSTGLNQLESPSTGLNQLESSSMGLYQLESSSTGLNQLESSSTGLYQLESLSSGLNQFESPSTDLNPLELESTDLNQLESPSTYLNQLESPSTDLNQLESPSTDLNQLESPSTDLNQLESPSTDLNQLESPSTDLNQLESPSTYLNQLESPSTDLNQLESPSTDLNQLESPSTDLNQLESPSTELNQLDSQASTKLNQLDSQASIALKQFEPPSILLNNLQLPLTLLNGFEPPSPLLNQLESPSIYLNQSDSHSPFLNQHPSTVWRPPECLNQWKPLSTNENILATKEIATITLSHKCHLCPFITTTKHLLMRHIYQRHEKSKKRRLKRPSKFKCRLCDYQSFQKKDFQIHSRKCPNKKARDSWKSKVCDYSILYREGMFLSPLKRFKCEHCDFICERKGQLKFHLTSSHHLKGQFVKGFKCFRCNQRFKNKFRVKVHCRKALVLNETQPAKPRKNYRCLFCIFHTKSRNIFNNHFRKEHRNKGLKCSHCKNTFKYLNILNRHLSAYHPFCELCNVSFSNKTTLVNHEPIHNRKCYVTVKKLPPWFSVPSMIICFKKLTRL